MKAKNIDCLNKRQVEQLDMYREKWLNIGLNTEPTDILAAEYAVKLCYQSAGLDEPKSIICVDSPLVAINLVNERTRVTNQALTKVLPHVSNQVSNQIHDQVWVGNQVRNQVWNQVLEQVRNQVQNQIYDQVWNQVWERVGNQVWDQVRDQVSNQVWNHVCDQVRDKVWDQVCDQVRDHVWDQVRDQVWDQISSNHVENQQVEDQQVEDQVDNRMQINRCYGCHDAGWLAPYDYLREVCGLVKETEKLTGLIALAKCCGWWMPYEGFAIIQNRPCLIGFDDEKRLHCDNEMAIKYRDGFGLWSIHGVIVDEQIVMKPDKQTVKQIAEEPNAEIKRIRIERFGWNRYLTKINAKVIDHRHNSIENTYETLVKTPDGMTILLPTCKTGRLFSLEVPSDILTCEQAQKWLHSGSMLDDIAGKTRVVGRS